MVHSIFKAIQVAKEPIKKSVAIKKDHNNLAWVGIPLKPQGFLMKAASYHAYTFTTAAVLQRNIHSDSGSGGSSALYQYHKDCWESRTDPLWSCFVSTNFSENRSRRTVRSWLVRKLRIAFKEAMAKQGYNTDGSPKEDKQVGKDVYGTVCFMAQEEMMTMKKEDLQARMDQAVSVIMNISAGRKPNSGLSKPKVKHMEQKPKVRKEPPTSRILEFGVKRLVLPGINSKASKGSDFIVSSTNHGV